MGGSKEAVQQVADQAGNGLNAENDSDGAHTAKTNCRLCNGIANSWVLSRSCPET